MKITVEFEGVQEGKEYEFKFSLTSDGKVKTSSPRKKSEKKDEPPTLEDHEPKAPTLEAPKLEEPKKTAKDFKVESSFGDKKLDKDL